MFWRLGIPGWRIAANLGIPIKIKIDVQKDEEVGVYFATSDDIGLAVESGTLDELMKEIHSALPVLLELEHVGNAKPETDIRLNNNLALA